MVVPTLSSHELQILDRDGALVVRGVLGTDELAVWRDEATRLQAGSRAAGIRAVASLSPMIADLARGERAVMMVASAIGEPARLVRSILFDTSPEANWDVPWHQDTTIAVREKREVEGFGPWSAKVGVPHVQPPAGVLAGMVTIRIHLDACPESNGALRIVPGSHRRGIVQEREIVFADCESAGRVYEAGAGDALLMKPLVLHASRKSVKAEHRRIIHLEYTAADLPGGLEWAQV